MVESVHRSDAKRKIWSPTAIFGVRMGRLDSHMDMAMASIEGGARNGSSPIDICGIGKSDP